MGICIDSWATEVGAIKAERLNKIIFGYFHCLKCKKVIKIQKSRLHLHSKNCKECSQKKLPYMYLFNIAKGQAQRTNRKWDISYDKFLKLVNSPCYYCGIFTHRPEHSNSKLGNCGYGIDRVNSNLDYISSNVVACCSICNRMKMQLDPNVFIQQCYKIANHLELGGLEIVWQST